MEKITPGDNIKMKIFLMKRKIAVAEPVENFISISCLSFSAKKVAAVASHLFRSPFLSMTEPDGEWITMSRLILLRL